MTAITLGTYTDPSGATGQPLRGWKPGQLLTVRAGAAQADTGQTDWMVIPPWATDMVVYLEVTAVVGTTPLTDFKLVVTDPVSLDDGFALDFANWNGITQIAGTTAGDIVVHVGPGITGIADDDTGPYYSINSPLPPVLGFRITLDRTTADETYTYNLRVAFKAR